MLPPAGFDASAASSLSVKYAKFHMPKTIQASKFSRSIVHKDLEMNQSLPSETIIDHCGANIFAALHRLQGLRQQPVRWTSSHRHSLLRQRRFSPGECLHLGDLAVGAPVFRGLRGLKTFENTSFALQFWWKICGAKHSKYSTQSNNLFVFCPFTIHARHTSS